MLKSKKYLAGLGAGLIIGAILVQLAHMGAVAELESQPLPTPISSESTERWTFNQLKDEAAKQNGRLLTNKEYDELKASKVVPSVAVTVTPNSVDKPKQIYIYIYQGMTSDAIEEYLFLAGIINDRVAFRDKIRSEGLTRKLKASLYSFTPGMELNQVIEKLKRINP
ncbi:MAG: hypothetical protein H7X86_03680 [Gorillibacterium sp.]|nr:hypothetical protein [Gorillibacterium sp.]